MNIFYLHPNPIKCARYHCDKHVVKMIVETAQLLCTAHWETGSSAHYKSTHRNHPSSKWVRQSIQHYRWLVSLGLELCKEYTYRYGRIHRTQTILDDLKMNEPSIPDCGFTQPPQAMPDEFKSNDSIAAYRNCYRYDKVRFARWKRRTRPHFMPNG